MADLDKDQHIIQDVIEKAQGTGSAVNASNIYLKAILIELRILNNRTGDAGDKSIQKGAAQALKSLTNFRS